MKEQSAITWNGIDGIDKKSLNCFWQLSDVSSRWHTCHSPNRPAFSESKSPTHSARSIKNKHKAKRNKFEKMRVERVNMDVFSFRSLYFQRKKKNGYATIETRVQKHSIYQNKHVYDCMIEHAVNFSFSNHIFCFRFHFRVLRFVSFLFVLAHFPLKKSEKCAWFVIWYNI